MALSLRQFAQHYTNGSTTPSVTVSATAAGSLIAVAICCRRGAGPPTVSSVTDSAGNTYSQVASARATMSANNGMTDVWYFANAASGITSVTPTLSAAPGDTWVAVWEIAGAATSSPVDTQGAANDQTTSVGATVTTANAADFIVGVETGPVNFTGIHAGNAFTEDAHDNANGVVLTAAWCHLITSATGSYNFQFDQNANNCSSTVAFKAAAVTGIQFDAASNSGYQAAQSTYSWSHTCTGANRYLAVDISLLSVPGTVVLALTYAGVEMDPLGARSTVSGAGRVECWGLTNPATGTNTISVTLSASVASSGTAVSYTGVNQQEPTEGFASAQATNVGATDATVNVVTVADNDWVHGAIATDDTAVTANQTSRNNVSGALGSGADEDTGPKTPAGSVTMSYTGVGALATWVIAAYAIRPTTAPVEDVVASWYTLRTVIEEEIEVLTN